MIIRDMFFKPIDRDIKGVVKVGQNDKTLMKQELEEYVVTDELQKHFRDFFAAYKDGVNNSTDNMGVWISGFFGSGKSHLLKILSYILSNNTICDKKAIEYFIEDNKINDPIVLADMKLASNISTDSILFNIDSKSDATGKKDKDSIVSVFLKVFNEMNGYCSTNPHVADLERELYNQDKYDVFKAKYNVVTRESWEDSRHKFNFMKGKVKQVLIESQIMDEISADEWIKSTTKPYNLSIEAFSDLVNKYILSKGNNHHVVFLVDEIGQYVGDNTDLMLNLQTVTEELGIACKGKAWVVVTSQQAIDSITEVKGQDFSKIQGRFYTRINLTSTDVSEVIKKRILEKNDTAKQTLSTIFEKRENVIRNLLVFNDGVEKKIYKDSSDFINVYPFIPYQFNLLSNVLTAIREHSSSGKHLSEGERSMLAMFKESAERIKEYNDGIIVSFDLFYDALYKFLDHSHAIVVSQALKNKVINPLEDVECFNVKVLKTLFLIKYVKEIRPNLDNITTLLVSNIEDDRFKLREEVKKALMILMGQTLVQKNGDDYAFLTNEEQEVERIINKQYVDNSELTKHIASEIFNAIYTEKKYRYAKFGSKYTFGYDQFIDGAIYGKQSNELIVHIVTPLSSHSGKDDSLRMMSTNQDTVYVALPNNDLFIKEYRQALRIEKYLSSSEARRLPKAQEINAIKSREMGDHKGRAIRALEQTIKNSDFYISGEKVTMQSKDFKSSLTEAIGKITELVYSKLNYITVSKELLDIKDLFKENRELSLISNTNDNENAIRDVIDFVALKTNDDGKISLKEIMDKFSKAPYGFIYFDIQWIIAKAFVEGKLEFILNGNEVSLLNETPFNIVEYLTKRQFGDKLLISIKEIIDQKFINEAKSLSREMFNKDFSSDDADYIAKSFINLNRELLNEIDEISIEYNYNDYPGKTIVDDSKILINQLLAYTSSKRLYKFVHERYNDFEKFTDDYAAVKVFFGGTQKKIWIDSLLISKVFEDSKNYFVNSDIEKITNEINKILSNTLPFDEIKDLPNLNSNFREIYNNILIKEITPIKEYIDSAKKAVIKRIEDLPNIINVEEVNSKFDEIIYKCENCNNLKDVNSYRQEADILKSRFINLLEANKTPGDDENNPTVKKIYISHIFSNRTIKSKDDLDLLLEELKEKLEDVLKDNDIFDVEF